MKATVDAKAFSDAMSKVSGILKKSVIPSVENICVDFRGGTCTVRATDLHTWMTAAIPAVGDDFSFVFDNTKNIMKACRYYDGEQTFSLFGTEDKPKLDMRCGDKAGEFPVIPAEEHPRPPEMKPIYRYTTNAGAMLERVKRVKYASAIIETKPVACGVRFTDKRIWCLDGYRLAISEDASLRVEEPFIVSAAALANLKAFGDANVDIYVGEKYADFYGNGVSLMTRLLESSDNVHPDTVTPKEWRDTYTVERKQYLGVLKYLAEFAGSKVKPYANFSRGELTLYAPTAKYSAAVGLDGACTIDYGVDLKYMKEALEQFPEEKYVTIRVSSSFAPILITANGRDTALVVPVRMRSDNRRAA